MSNQTVSSVGSTDRDRSPLFSVVWCGRDNSNSARVTIDALRTQTLRDFELVVEDCGSSDGTLELFEAAAASDPRIRIVHRLTTRLAEALLTALRRCRGEYVAICPMDGAFLPQALEVAAQELTRRPDAGGVATRGFLIDGYGNELDRVDVVSLLLTNYRPYLPAVFFRRRALLAVGIADDDWFTASLALDLCCRLSTDYGLAYCSERLVDCPEPTRSVDGVSTDVAEAIDDRLRLVTRVFSADGFFGRGYEVLALESKANQLGILWQQFRAAGRSEVEYLITGPLRSVVWGLHLSLRMDHRTLRTLHRLLCVRSANLGLLATPLQRVLALIADMKGRLPIHVGYTIWNQAWGYWLKRKIVLLTLPGERFHHAAPSRGSMFADIYALAAARYEERGQIDLAIEMWEQARPPDNVDVDSTACQAILKSPSATDATLAAFQRKWVRRHLDEAHVVHLSTKRGAGGKIRVGYHCAFMDGDTMRNMMRNVIAAHDRDRFEIYGYAPRPVPPDIKGVFDAWRHTPPDADTSPGFNDERFRELVRSDDIDVFVELTGFSPGHRFGAMSRRCAPVQVSFLNHTGTSQVPNVDYVLSDEICTPSNSGIEQHYSEQIYRLPRCFFCFDYSSLDEPPVAEPPHLKNGFITFGCFGTAGKIGSDLIDRWAMLLHHVPGSMLHVQNPQLSLAGNRRFMVNRFRSRGISPGRLRLEGGVSRRELLKVYRQIDISLDTWPYCGGNTIAESLWHGVPVVTYCGNRFSSAYGASLVTAAGCPDLVARSADEYVELAARLARDSSRLVHLRQNLRQMSLRHGLGDSRRFAKNLEHAFSDMLALISATDSTVVAQSPTSTTAVPREPGYADAFRR